VTDLNFIFEFDQARLHGMVVAGHYKGDHVKSRNFAMAPKKGDCASSPLVRSEINGTLWV